MAGRHCACCSHPAVAEIDAMLSSGAACAAVAAKYGMSRPAVARHRERHLSPRLQAAAHVVARSQAPAAKQAKQAKAILAGQEPDPTTALDLVGLLGRVARSLNRLEHAADETASEKAYTALAAISAQLHRGVDVAGKLQGLGVAKDAPRDVGYSITIQIDGGEAPGRRVVLGQASEVRGSEMDYVGDAAVELAIPVPTVAPTPLRVPPDLIEPEPEAPAVARRQGPFPMPSF